MDLNQNLQFDSNNRYTSAHQVLSYLFNDYLGAFVIHLWNDSKLHIGNDFYERACAEVIRQNLQGRVTIDLRDYRELPQSATYDKIFSIGMFEHVGLKNLPTYFSIVNHLLKPNGLFLNHGITTVESGWGQCASSRFINRLVFPDGDLKTVSVVQSLMEDAVNLVGERNYRIWRLYMTGCELQIEHSQTRIYQVLAVQKNNNLSPLPLTSRDLYEDQDRFFRLH